MISEYRTKEIFLALKAHFTDDNYDYLKYDGKLKTQPKIASWHFSNIANRFINKSTVEEFFLSNFVMNYQNDLNISSFIGDYTDKLALKKYNDWKVRRANLSRWFFDYINSSRDQLKKNIILQDEKISIIDAYFSRKIPIEFLVVVYLLYPSIMKIWKEYCSTDPLKEGLPIFILKYSQFFDRYFNMKKVIDKMQKL